VGTNVSEGHTATIFTDVVMMEAVYSSITLAITCYTVWLHNLDDHSMKDMTSLSYVNLSIVQITCKNTDKHPHFQPIQSSGTREPKGMNIPSGSLLTQRSQQCSSLITHHSKAHIPGGGPFLSFVAEAKFSSSYGCAAFTRGS
jgi:hypothetical protein